MANKNLKSIKFPNLPDTYIIPQGTVTEADLEESEGKKADAIVRSASGEIASYDDGGDLPMKSLKVNIVPTQSGSGDPSPQNIRPISGTDEVNVYKSGADTSDYETITKTLPQTVYGGTLDVVSGKLSIDRAMVDAGALNWSKLGTSYITFGSTSLANVIKQNNASATAICSQYKAESSSSASGSADNYVWVNTNKLLAIKDTSKANMTDAEFKTAMNGVQLVYELATPTEIDLTPTEVKSLLGDNNVWSDSGTVEVEYRADTSLVINKILEALEG